MFFLRGVLLKLIQSLEAEEQARFETIVTQKKRKDVPQGLFTVFIEMQKNLVPFQSEEQKEEAIKLLDLENYHQLFDEMIQRASSCCGPSSKDSSTQSIASTSNNSFSSFSTSNFSYASPSTVSLTPKPISSLYFNKEPVKTSELLTRDDSYVPKSKSIFNGDAIRPVLQSNDVFRPQIVDSTLKPATTYGENEAN